MRKTTNDVVAFAGLLLSLAGYLAALGTTQSVSLATRLKISSHTFQLLGLTASVTGLGLFLWPLVGAVIKIVRKVRPSKLVTLRVRRAYRFELPELRVALVREFGEKEVAPLRWIQAWYDRNPNIFVIVISLNMKTGVRKIVGGFKLVPVSKEAIFCLEQERYTGANLPLELIVRNRNEAHAWYVGDVFGGSPAMRALIDSLRKCLIPDTAIYARALKTKGLGYLRDFGFVPVGERPMGLGVMCTLFAPRVDELMGRLKSGEPLRPDRRKKNLGKVTVSDNRHIGHAMAAA